MDWYYVLDGTLNWDYPPDSSFKSESESRKFREDGEDLYKRLQDELGDEFNIIYRPWP